MKDSDIGFRLLGSTLRVQVRILFIIPSWDRSAHLWLAGCYVFRGNEEMVRNMAALHTRSIPDPFLHSLLAASKFALYSHVAVQVKGWEHCPGKPTKPQSPQPNPAGHFKSRGPQCFLFVRLISF